MSVDSFRLKFSRHTCFRLSFFLLKTPFMMNGQPAQITFEDGHLTLSCRYPPVSITFDSLVTEVDAVVKKYGLDGVSNYWCEEVPLFELKLTSQGQNGLRKFYHLQDQVQDELASRIATLAQRQQSVDPIAVYAHTEVHMVTPCPERKDAEVLLVTPDNLDTCTTVWRESEVFDFSAVYRTLRIDRKTIPNEGKVTLALLDQELYEVSEWFHLGLHLGVPAADLQMIDYEPTLRRIPQRRVEMLTVRMKMLPEPSWSQTVAALMKVGRESLAQKIALKYGVSVPASVEKKPLQLDTPSQMSKYLQQVEKLRRELETKDRELVLQNLALGEARRKEGAVNQKLTQFKQTLQQTEAKTVKLIQLKKDVDNQLELKKKELKSLCTRYRKDSEELQSKIRNKEEEIQGLQSLLHSVEEELASEKKVTQDLKDKVHQADVELAEKSALAHEREKRNGDFKIQLEEERQRVDRLLMLLTKPSTSGDQYIRKIEGLLANAKLDRESSAKEIGQHKLTITQLEGKNKTLLLQLQKKEGLIQKLEQESVVARKGGTKLELELGQQLFQLKSEVAGLTEKLEKVEKCKQDAVREMEAAQLKRELMQHQMAELGEQTHTHTQSELQIPLKLKWRKGRDMLWEAKSYPKTVQVRNNLYVGGCTSSSDDYTLQAYDTESDEWTKLPEYQYCLFGIALVNDHLTLVGGRDRDTTNVTNKLGVWNPTSEQWTHPYPPMITPRCRSEVATYNNYLLAAGGEGDRHLPLNTVEMLDVRAGQQWLSATQLPTPCEYMSSAILHENWYIITQNKQVMYISLPHLCTIPKMFSKSTTNKTPAQWHHLPNTPLYHSTAIVLHGSLLTVGGSDGNNTSTAIHLYHPQRNTWNEVGNLPTPRKHCAVALLPNGDILIAGGHNTRIDIAAVMN